MYVNPYIAFLSDEAPLMSSHTTTAATASAKGRLLRQICGFSGIGFLIGVSSIAMAASSGAATSHFQNSPV